MPSSPPTHASPLEPWVSKMVSLKEEHRPILEKIAADEGMSAETRRLLVSHVLDEEDEAVEGLSQAHNRQTRGQQADTQGSARATDANTRASTIGVLTVGSLKRRA